MIILCLCFGQVILRDTSVESKQRDLQHVMISMDDKETLEARFLGRDNVVLDVQCYCCAHCTFSDCTYGVVCLLYIWCCVHIAYVVLGIDGSMYMLDMQRCVHIALCA